MVWQKRYFTEEEKRNAIRNSKAKYMLNKKCFSDICKNNHDCKLAGKWTHLKSKKHIKYSESI